MSQALGQLKVAMQLHMEGKFEPAEQIYQAVLTDDRNNVDANHLLGLIRTEQDRNSEGLAYIEHAIRLNPNVAAFHHNIAGIYRRLGRIEASEAGYRRAIELKSDYAESYQGLAEMVRFKADDPFIIKLKQELKTPDLSAVKKSYYHFAAGKFYDDTGQFDLAFKHYQSGNVAANRNFDTAGFFQQVKNMLYVFDAERVAALSNVGHESQQPVFVVGMPRSGTSLIEQILASHTQVYGAGELNDMKFIARQAATMSKASVGALVGAGMKSVYPECCTNLSADQFAELGMNYIKRINAPIGQCHARVVDKHPLNFIYIGLILAILPQAKIIHAQRNPLDTLLSCYFQNFSKGQDYCFDLTALGGFYNNYKRLMSHWNQQYGDRILALDYECLLQDQENQTRRLLDFCELEFEPECLQFYDTERPVKTASFLQVRKPLYQTARGRWRNYQLHLQELAAVIGEPIEVPVTISNFTAGKLSYNNLASTNNST
ncbi:MAG: sulfotransferase [Pseudomonadales bacterium]|nr:sulfotransferase [Pseudomonadales bacterium]